MRQKIVNFFEAFIVTAILLVLVQTFLEDYAVIAGWSWDKRRIMVVTGFTFDLIFTIEFLIRYFSAMSRGEAGMYFREGRGWIDFLASIPLLLLNSGPSFLALVLGGGIAFGVGSMLNILKIVKAIRIARVLRLLRILKIFRQIKYIGSTMAQRHITKINTISITAVVFTLFFFTLFADFMTLPTVDSAINAQHVNGINNFLEGLPDKNTSSKVSIFSAFDPELLIIKDNGTTLYSRYNNSYYEKQFGPGDFAYVNSNGWDFFFDARNSLKVQSVYNILFFIIVIVLVLSYLIIYSPHFAITVTDPLHVMRKGLSDITYSLEVKIPQKYEDDDVFVLGNLYNKHYLPMKQRDSDSRTTKSDIVMDDLSDLF